MKKNPSSLKCQVLLTVILAGIIFCITNGFNHYSSIGGNLICEGNRVSVPLGGNTWSSPKEEGRITSNGIENWTDRAAIFTTYLRVSKAGTLKVWLDLKVPDGKSALSITIKGRSEKINAEGTDAKDHYAGEWNIADTGYIAIQLKGLSKTGNAFAEVSNLKLEGTAINDRIAFTKNNEGNFFYWGRRGPSVHLNYAIPGNVNAEWFYNEVTVPMGEDVMGSYFMADGF